MKKFDLDTYIEALNQRQVIIIMGDDQHPEYDTSIFEKINGKYYSLSCFFDTGLTQRPDLDDNAFRSFLASVLATPDLFVFIRGIRYDER